MQSQLHLRDESKQTVAADRQAKEIAMLGTRAAPDDPVGAQEVEANHLIDDRLECEATPVRIAGQCPADAQAIGAGLLLINPPLPLTARLRLLERGEQPRPLDAVSAAPA